MNTSNNFICIECVTDVYLKSYFEDEGIDTCSYCKEKNQIIPIEDFSDIVNEALEEHFQLTPDQPSSFEYAMSRETDYDWEREGQQLNYILQEIAGIDENIISDVLKYLSDVYTEYELLQMGEEDPFSPEAHYEESPANQFYMEESWKALCSEVKTRARFFSSSVKSTLDELFQDLDVLESYGNDPLITSLTPRQNFFLYRARIAETEEDVERILKSPVEELGAPPSKYASSGRMNPVGIPVFYGAENKSTCINEVRPPVGCHIVVGKFEVLHDIKLLDLNALSRVVKKNVSYFDPEAAEIWGRIAFLRRLVKELTRPVMPSDEGSEYLPTQVVAEYLSEQLNPRLDGLIFKSSQSADEGNNIVLFNHASQTEAYKIPDNTEVSINFGWSSGDDYDDSITINEKLAIEVVTEDEEQFPVTKTLSDNSDVYIDGEGVVTLQSDRFTLKLDVDNIEVSQIKGVTYDDVSRSVSRYKSKGANDIPF